MSRLTLSYQNLYDRVDHFLGLTAEGTSPTGNDLTLCKDIVARGIRQFLYPINAKTGTPHRWSFLEQYWTFHTVGSQWKYSLPVDFSELCGRIIYDDSDALPALKKRNGQQIEELRSLSDSTGWPEFYAIVPARYDLELGTTYELWLYPTPSQAYTLSCWYRIDPIKLSATSDLAIGGIRAIEAILESCLAVAETQEEDNKYTHHQSEAQRLIQTLIQFDLGTTDADTVGNLYHRKMLDFGKRRLITQDISLVDDIYADDR